MATADKSRIPALVTASPTTSILISDGANQSASVLDDREYRPPPDAYCSSSSTLQLSDSTTPPGGEAMTFVPDATDDVMDISEGVASLPSVALPSVVSAPSSSAAPLPSNGGLPSRSYSSVTSGASLPTQSTRLPLADAHVQIHGDSLQLDVPHFSPAAQELHSTRELGVCLDALPNTPLKVYCDTLLAFLPAGAITHLTRRPRTVIVYFTSKEHADTLLNFGLDLGDHHLEAEPISRRPVQVSLHPVPPEISDAMICTALSKCGKIVGPVITHSAAPKDPANKNVRSFRRSVRLIFPSEEHLRKFPRILNVRCGQLSYRIDMLTSEHCANCKELGHQRARCPNNQYPAPTASTVPTASKQPPATSRSRPAPSSNVPTAPGPSYTKSISTASRPRASFDADLTSHLQFPVLTSPITPHPVATSGDFAAGFPPVFTVGVSECDGGADNSSDSASASRASSLPGKRISGTRTGTRRKRKKKKSSSADGQPFRTTKSSGDISPSPAPTEIERDTDDDGSPPSFEVFSSVLSKCGAPSEPLNLGDYYQFCTHTTNLESTYDYLREREDILPALLLQAGCIAKYLRGFVHDPLHHSWTLGCVNRLQQLLKVAPRLLQPTTDQSIQGHDP